MRDPLPKELVIDACTARVGYSLDNNFTQCACSVSVHVTQENVKKVTSMFIGMCEKSLRE